MKNHVNIPIFISLLSSGFGKKKKSAYISHVREIEATCEDIYGSVIPTYIFLPKKKKIRIVIILLVIRLNCCTYVLRELRTVEEMRMGVDSHASLRLTAR